MTDDDARRAVHAEARPGPGRRPGHRGRSGTGAFEHDVIDRVKRGVRADHRRREGAGGDAGDHFAKPGANDRVWNALEKLAVADPEAFVDYYANDVIALVIAAWLGPGYQVTSQVNVRQPRRRRRRRRTATITSVS